MINDAVALREYLETLHRDYVAAHNREHGVHEAAHAREHQLNKDAIDKAESSVDKAVSAARETMDKSIEGLSGRIEQAATERRRELDDMRGSINTLRLDLVATRSQADGNAKSIQAIQEALSWLVRLVVGAIILAILALIFRPGVF